MVFNRIVYFFCKFKRFIWIQKGEIGIKGLRFVVQFIEVIVICFIEGKLCWRIIVSKGYKLGKMSLLIYVVFFILFFLMLRYIVVEVSKYIRSVLFGFIFRIEAVLVFLKCLGFMLCYKYKVLQVLVIINLVVRNQEFSYRKLLIE